MIKQNLAFVFPGQGAQKVGMLAALAEHYPVVKETFSEASEVLGFDLWALCQEGPQEALNKTETTQPLLLTCATASYRVWCEQSDVRPGVVAGHSLGEWSALVAAGILPFKEAVRLVQLRGRYMQEAVPEGQGGMAAVLGLDDATLVSACTELGVYAVNFNCPGQVVVAGDAAAITASLPEFKALGAKRALPLAVSAPFHTPMMKPAAERLESEAIEALFTTSDIAVVQNISAAYETEASLIRKQILDQVYSPVRWTESVQAMINTGVDTFIECAPGKVLNGLIKKIDKSVTLGAIETPEGLAQAIEAVK